ncbi:MAG: DUF104 domain-containing protein [Methanocellales archaeon]|nr:DUF104 domain-containing protein [Methanocellales archaeon]
MPISAVYKDGVIKPSVKLDLKENEEIEIEIKRKMSIVDEITGRINIDPKMAKEIAESKELALSMWED